jgi:hypothetical protein
MQLGELVAEYMCNWGSMVGASRLSKEADRGRSDSMAVGVGIHFSYNRGAKADLLTMGYMCPVCGGSGQ